jgi:hypothetical protein
MEVDIVVEIIDNVPDVMSRRIIAVMNQNRRGTGQHIVRVELLDGEVPAVCLTRGDPGGDYVDVAVGGRVEGVGPVMMLSAKRRMGRARWGFGTASTVAIPP